MIIFPVRRRTFMHFHGKVFYQKRGSIVCDVVFVWLKIGSLTKRQIIHSLRADLKEMHVNGHKIQCMKPNEFLNNFPYMFLDAKKITGDCDVQKKISPNYR